MEIGRVEFITKPWQHQLEAIRRAENRDCFALFMDMGCGKSGTAINILRQKMNREKRFLKTLILCPPIVIENWKREFGMHSKIPPEKIVLLTGPGEKRLKTFERENHEPRIFVTNYEALQMTKLFEAFKRYEFDALVCDESQRLKNPSGVRTKLATQLVDGELDQEQFKKTGQRIYKRKPVKYRFILSGTPILNTAMDVFSQYRIMDGGELFGQNFYGFRAQFFYDKNAGMPSYKHFPNWLPRPDTHARLNSMIYSKAMRVMKADCLDLPPLVRETIGVELGREQARLYEEMKRDFVAYLNDKACVAQLAITKALRLQQIASGYMQTDAGEAVALKENPRLDALRELLGDLATDHKVIVWAVFKENYRQIKEVCAGLGLPAVTITGEDSSREKFAAVEAFERDPATRICIANQAAGGVGINLVAASYSIFFSRSFSLEADLQAEARNYRGGSERHSKITRIDLVARNTIDELVLQALSAKQNIAEEVLKWRAL